MNVVQSAAESTPADDADEVAEEITGFVPPDEARGHVALTDVTQYVLPTIRLLDSLTQVFPERDVS